MNHSIEKCWLLQLAISSATAADVPQLSLHFSFEHKFCKKALNKLLTTVKTAVS